MTSLSKEHLQRAFDVQSLGRVINFLQLSPIFFEVDTNEDYTYIGYLSSQEKNQENIFHRKIEFERVAVETTTGIFFVAIGIPRESLVIEFGSANHHEELQKILNQFSRALMLSQTFDHHKLMTSHKSDRYFFIYQL